MLAHKLTLADGTVLGPGVIRSVTLTEQVNDQDDLCPGAACAACAEIELWAPAGALGIAQGGAFALSAAEFDPNAAAGPTTTGRNAENPTTTGPDSADPADPADPAGPAAGPDLTTAGPTNADPADPTAGLVGPTNADPADPADPADTTAGSDLTTAGPTNAGPADTTDGPAAAPAWQQLGVFVAEQPARASANLLRVTAYDRMTLLDRDLSPWLRAQQGAFPMALGSMVQAVCAQCGVALADGALDGVPNAGYPVQAFYADGITGRQLIQWAAQAFCRFARMTPQGRLTFGWYAGFAPAGVAPAAGSRAAAVSLAGALLATADGALWAFAQRAAGYLAGTLSYADYATAPIDKVQIRQSDDDIGVIYPPDAAGSNALVLQGNLLLTTAAADALQPVAQAIYNEMAGLCYTPLTVSVQAAGGALPAAGDIVAVTDAQGRQLSACVMRRTAAGQRLTLESTGNPRRDSCAAVNRQSYKNLQGRVLELSADVDGLRVTAADLAGGQAQLELTVDGLQTSVAGKLDEAQAETMIDQSLAGITLTAENGGDTSTLTLKAGDVTLSSAEIEFDGLVTFSDLAGSGSSSINGDNITTGTLGSAAGNTVYDLDAGTIRTGRSNGSHVNVNDRGVNWYVQNGSQSYLTGVLYSVYGTSYLGANSQYVNYGWVNSATPTSYRGMQVDNGSNRTAFNTAHVDVTGGDLGVSGTVSTRDLSAWGNKNRVLHTPLGDLAFAAMESPEPAFCDYGGGVVGAQGVCPLCHTPPYAAAAAPQAVRWLITPVDGPGSFWVERQPWGALVHGTPGSRFDWLCIAAQRDMAGLYAPPSAAGPPPEADPAADAAQTLCRQAEAEQHRAALRAAQAARALAPTAEAPQAETETPQARPGRTKEEGR